MSAVVLDSRAIVEALSCLKVGVSVEDIIHPSEMAVLCSSFLVPLIRYRSSIAPTHSTMKCLLPVLLQLGEGTRQKHKSCQISILSAVKADRVQTIYRAFCTEVLELPEKSLSELPFECQFTSDMIDMHQKSEPLLLLFNTMRCFAMDFGDANTDLIMCDLINPQPKRTRKLLSLVADYTNFYRVASRVFEKTTGEYDHARRAIEEGLEQVRLAEERKNALRSDRDSRKRKENGLLAESSKKNAILTELMKEAQASESRRDGIMKSIEDGKQEIIKAAAEIEAFQNEIQHLSKGLVKSPVRVRNDVNEQRLRIKQYQENCDAERQRILGNNESMSIIEQASKKLDERFRELERLRDFQAETNLLEHECENFEAQVAEASKFKMQKEEALSRFLQLCDEKEKSHRRALELYGSRLQDLRTRKKELTSIVENLRKIAPSVRDESVQLQKEMVQLRNERTEETDLARRYCLELQRRFFDLLEKYHKAEELFDAQIGAFSEVVRKISTRLNDLDLAAGDLGSLSD